LGGKYTKRSSHKSKSFLKNNDEKGSWYRQNHRLSNAHFQLAELPLSCFINSDCMKKVQVISSGPMADIAFLLLIFFLVTTTFEQDKGVRQEMMPLHPVNGMVKTKHIASISINAKDQIRLDGKDVPLSALSPKLVSAMKEHNGQILFELKTSPKSSYPTYVAVHSEIKKGYNRFYEEESERLFSKSYSRLTNTEKKYLQSKYPKTIREVEVYQ
jgi:biopolymer transport protein ExbD